MSLCCLCMSGSLVKDISNEKENILIKSCDNCGSGTAVIDENLIDYSDYGNFWENQDAEYYSQRVRNTSLMKKILFSRIKKTYSKNAKILDFGSGCGIFVKNAELNGFSNVYGYEISDKLKNIAIEKVGIENSINSLLDSDLQFDVITMFDVIEHLPPTKINEIMVQIYDALEPGGVLIGTTPNYKSLNIKISKDKDPVIAPPDHTLYFSRKGLDALLLRTGLVRKMSVTLGFNTNGIFRVEKFKPSWVEVPNQYQKYPAKIIKILTKCMSFVIMPVGLGYHHYFIYQKNDRS